MYLDMYASSPHCPPDIRLNRHSGGHLWTILCPVIRRMSIYSHPANYGKCPGKVRDHFASDIHLCLPSDIYIHMKKEINVKEGQLNMKSLYSKISFLEILCPQKEYTGTFVFSQKYLFFKLVVNWDILYISIFTSTFLIYPYTIFYQCFGYVKPCV